MTITKETTMPPCPPFSAAAAAPLFFLLVACAPEPTQVTVTVEEIAPSGSITATILSDLGPLTIETIVGDETPSSCGATTPTGRGSWWMPAWWTRPAAPS